MTIAPEVALFEKYKSRIGEVIGVSDWLVVTQRDADLFSELTDDWDYMHNDPAWAEPRLGGTIAHALYVMAMIPKVMKSLVDGIPIISSETASSLNYGYNNVRVIRPLLIGERFKDTVTVKDVVEKRPGDYLVTDQHTFVKEGHESPFLVLEKLGYFTTGYEEKWRLETTVKR